LRQPVFPVLPVDINRFMPMVFMVVFVVATRIEQVRNDMQSAIPSRNVIRSNIATVDHEPGEVAGRTRKRNLGFVPRNLNIYNMILQKSGKSEIVSVYKVAGRVWKDARFPFHEGRIRYSIVHIIYGQMQLNPR
jgi:hypothetical protein